MEKGTFALSKSKDHGCQLLKKSAGDGQRMGSKREGWPGNGCALGVWF